MWLWFNTNGTILRQVPPILVYFSGDWDVRWGYGVLTDRHVLLGNSGQREVRIDRCRVDFQWGEQRISQEMRRYGYFFVVREQPPLKWLDSFLPSMISAKGSPFQTNTHLGLDQPVLYMG